MNPIRTLIIATFTLGLLTMATPASACKITPETLKKYDSNGDGKLDAAEKAAMKKDRKESGKSCKNGEEKKKESPKHDSSEGNSSESGSSSTPAL